MQGHTHRPYRSLFWPVIFIGIGLLWLLSNLGTIVQINLPVVFRLWPLLLIFVGLDILLSRRSPLVGAALGGLAVLLVIGFTLGGRTLGISPDVQARTEHFITPISAAQSASVLLAFSDSPVTITALSDSQNLIDAQLTYVGTINFHSSGTTKKTVRLSRNEADFLLLNPLYWDPSLNWQIGLTTRIPLDLSVDGGSGDSQVDLSRLVLQKLKVVMGSGASHFTAPIAGNSLNIQVSGGSGAMEWTIPDGASFTMRLSGGSGSIHIQLPALPAVRLEVRNSGIGEIKYPNEWLKRFGGRADEGAWESPNYRQSPRKIEIIITHVGSGSIQIG
ncbi:MAG: DUF5668 domain-containing protein [Anaerolineaceae bacterium]|nr:DUF5668 domain-containing protein [Anaerolineaceae bacterium]